MSPVIILTLSAAAFFTSIISAVVGMAGGIVLLSIMTFFMSIEAIVPVHGMTQLASNTARSRKLKESIEWKIVGPSILGLLLGTYVSTQIIIHVEKKEVFYFLISALIFYTIFKPKKLPSLKIPFWSFSILGMVVGILGPMIGATGPLLAPFYLRDDLSKEQIVASKAANQAVGHFLKIPAFLYLGFNYSEHFLLMLSMIICVIAGTYFGVSILKKINENHFRLLFKSALFVAACRVLYKAADSIM